MPFTTYAELQTEIADFIVHDDVTSKAGDLIRLFEAAANDGLRMHERESRAQHTVPAGETHQYITLPTDWGGPRAVRRDCGPIEYVTPSEMDYIKAFQPGLTVNDEFFGYYTIEAQTIRLYPSAAAGESIEFLYWKNIPALSATNTTNWLLALRPDLYLYGSLMHAGVYIKDPATMKTVSDMWQTLTADLKKSDWRKKYGTGTLKVRVRGRR